MTQFGGGQAPLGANVDLDAGTSQGSVTNEDLLPSGVDPSGLSAAVRQRVDAQVQSAGNADQVVAAIRARIAEIDGQTVPEDDPSHTQLQAERALAVAQISYLEEHHGADPMSGFDAATSGSAVASTHSTSVFDSVSSSAGSSVQSMSGMSGSMGSSRRRARTYDAGG